MKKPALSKKKMIITIFLTVLLMAMLILYIGNVLFEKTYNFPKKVIYGISFSPEYTTFLKLDWQKIYFRILDELKVKKIRLPSYWRVIEKNKGQYDFSELDFMVKEASKRDTKVLLVVGIRQPRWPECHIPEWARALSVKERQQLTLKLVEAVVKRYQGDAAVWGWQVENEPMFEFFGEGCDKPDKTFLKSEVELVRKLDSRPVILTDSGELGFWRLPMKLSDIFGTTLYRTVYNDFTGYTTYPIYPYLYNLKSALVRKLFAPNNQKTVIVELQAEAWYSNKSKQTPDQNPIGFFSLDKFKEYIRFSQRTGFDEAYLWGAEWWYWVESKGYPQYLEYAKTLF